MNKRRGEFGNLLGVDHQKVRVNGVKIERTCGVKIKGDEFGNLLGRSTKLASFE